MFQKKLQERDCSNNFSLKFVYTLDVEDDNSSLLFETLLFEIVLTFIL
jgi:hypothetical protein